MASTKSKANQNTTTSATPKKANANQNTTTSSSATPKKSGRPHQKRGRGLNLWEDGVGQWMPAL